MRTTTNPIVKLRDTATQDPNSPKYAKKKKKMAVQN